MDEQEITEKDKVLGIIGTDKKSVIEKIVQDNKILKGIGEMAQFFSSDDEIIFEYDRDKLMMEDMKQVLTDEITERVTKEVTEEVSKLKTREIASKMIDAGVDISIISSTTGLSIDELDSL